MSLPRKSATGQPIVPVSIPSRPAIWATARLTQARPRRRRASPPAALPQPVVARSLPSEGSQTVSTSLAPRAMPSLPMLPRYSPSRRSPSPAPSPDLLRRPQRDMAECLKKLEHQFTLTPQRMRMQVSLPSPRPPARSIFLSATLSHAADERARSRQLANPLSIVSRIVDSFVETLERGLAKEGQEIAMFPTYVFGSVLSPSSASPSFAHCCFPPIAFPPERRLDPTLLWTSEERTCAFVWSNSRAMASSRSLRPSTACKSSL